jgi:myo-inositol-1(or 4)-monophosphatase
MSADADVFPDPETQHAIRQIAEAAAQASGDVARRYFGTEYDVRLKQDRSEVSEADEAAQDAAIEVIRKVRPDDTFLTEEDLPESHDAPPRDNDRVCWIIDPIDGTRNFVRHIPLYSCSVGAMIGGFPFAGAICNPDRRVIYSASRAEGMFIDDHLLPPVDERPPAPAYRRKPVVGIPSSPKGDMARIAHNWLDRFVCRNLGSTALHLALVAAGELDGMFADNPKLWDIAAGWVMIDVSGGRMTSIEGKSLFPVDVATYHAEQLPAIAGSTAVHDELLRP